MKKLQLIVGLIIGTIILGSIGLIGYNTHYWKNIAPKYDTVSTSYVDNLTYVPTEEYFIEFNYLSNDLNNGKEVFEVRLNYYTDATIPQSEEDYKNVYSSGIQFIGEPKFKYKENNRVSDVWIFKTGTKSLETIPSSLHYFYNTTNSTSYGAISELGVDNDAWIVDFNGIISLIKQKGYTTDDDAWVKKASNNNYYEEFNIMSFIKRAYNSIESLENGYHVLQFDLSKWFTGFMLDESGKKFETTEHANQNWLFVNCKVNRSPNGLVSATQSIFNIVENNPNYAIAGLTPSDYWQSKTIYNLTIEDFDFITYQGNETLARLKPAAINYLRAFSNLDCYVDIDLDSQFLKDKGITLAGLAINPFGVLNVKQTSIVSKTQTTFKLYEQISNLNLTNVSIEYTGGAAA